MNLFNRIGYLRSHMRPFPREQHSTELDPQTEEFKKGEREVHTGTVDDFILGGNLRA